MAPRTTRISIVARASALARIESDTAAVKTAATSSTVTILPTDTHVPGGGEYLIDATHDTIVERRGFR